MNTSRNYEVAMLALLPRRGSRYGTRKQNKLKGKKTRNSDESLQHQDLNTEKSNFKFAVQRDL